MRTALVVLLASLAMLLAGCGSTIKPEGAAQSVVDLVSKQAHFKPNDVKCPSGVDAEVGKEFECHFTGPEGKEYTAQMKVTKVEGENVEFYIKTAPSK
jgi:NAD(P)H-hydrate repair Nnr-like enzyme with NAD(P)H-hydrate epimerase domain